MSKSKITHIEVFSRGIDLGGGATFIRDYRRTSSYDLDLRRYNLLARAVLLDSTYAVRPFLHGMGWVAVKVKEWEL